MLACSEEVVGDSARAVRKSCRFRFPPLHLAIRFFLSGVFKLCKAFIWWTFKLKPFFPWDASSNLFQCQCFEQQAF